MKGFLRVIGRALMGLVVLGLVAWIAVAVLRWRAVGDRERAAVALMDVPPPALAGSNGFAALMLAEFDVPVGEQDAALAADVARFERWQADLAARGSFWSATGGDSDLMASYEPFADAPWPRRPPTPGGQDAPLCPLRSAGCLAQVQAAPDAVRELLQVHAARSADVERALAADHVFNAYPDSIATPLPPLAAMRLPLTAAALDAVDGRVPEAYARTCRLLVGARRMDREGRNLVEKFVAQALGEGAAQLLLELRRAHPVAALPDDCMPALTPDDGDEAAICNAMRGEYRMHRAIDRQLSARLEGWRPDALMARALLYDSDLQAAWAASAFAPYCTDDARALAATGVAPPPPALPVSSDTADCYAALLSCTLMEMAFPDFGDYAGRSLDHAARLRLLLAAQAVADGRVDAPTAAAGAGNTGYPVTFEPQTQVATIRLQSPRRDEGETFAVDFAGLAPVVAETSFAVLSD